MTKGSKTEEKKSFLYKSTFDPLLARLYNNTTCSQCNGNGYIVSEIPPEGLDYFIKGVPNREVYAYCQCVDNNVKKQRAKEKIENN